MSDPATEGTEGTGAQQTPPNPPPWPDVSKASRGLRPYGPAAAGRLRLLAAVVVLALLAGVAAIAGWSAHQRAELRDRLAEQQRAAVEQQQQNQALADQLRQTQADLDRARRDLGGSQGQADELKRQKKVIADCLQLLAQANQAALAGDRDRAAALVEQSRPKCDEAARYLE